MGNLSSKVKLLLVPPLLILPLLTGCGPSAQEKIDAALKVQVKEQIAFACNSYKSDETAIDGFKRLGNLDISYIEIAVAADNHEKRLKLLALSSEDGPLGALVKALNEARLAAGQRVLSTWEEAETNNPEIWNKGLEGQQKLDIFCGVN
jgi:hypothetical protein